MVTLTIRTVTYVCLRLLSSEKIIKWVYIKPSIFYLMFTTDIIIVGLVLFFIRESSPRRDSFVQP